ncbi:techylectin-like protein [Rhopilema esculentum]|uniref:techylectin-like protein n=1 Tax=Rhopilema esculentum TaxID=499914 RepID=UPI0031DE596F
MRLHIVDIFWFQAYFLFVKSNFATIGNFFQQTENGDEVSLKMEEAFIKPEFFHCDRATSCSRVLKRQGAGHYQTNTEVTPLEEEESVIAAWKKVKQPTDCKDLYDSGKRDSGIYEIIRPNSNNQVMIVNCDMETDGGGWTVIQRRIDGSTDYQRGWSDYKDGFGDVGKNMWIGLENMHYLASPDASTTLRIDLKHRLKGDELFFATYRSFQISDESDRYRISVSGYSGTAGDAFNMLPSHMTNNNMVFSTKDSDNDNKLKYNCADTFKGGWWYNGCHNCQLNGLFPSKDSSDPIYMSWGTIDDNHGNVNFSEMKIRRN